MSKVIPKVCLTSALALAGDFLLGEAEGEREESMDLLGESLALMVEGLSLVAFSLKRPLFKKMA